MKVFFYIPTIATSGAEKQCQQLAILLKSRMGYETEMIITHPVLSNERMVEELRERGIQIHACNWKTFGGLLRMYRLFRSSGRDSALLCYHTFPDFIGGVVGRLAGLKRIYGGVRTECLPMCHVVMDWIAQRLFLTGTIFNSHKAYDKFIAKYGFSKKKSLVITNFIQESAFVHDYDKPSDGVKVITVGTFKPPKDYRTWLETIAFARQRNAAVKGVIVGYGELESEIIKWCKELGLEDVVSIVPGKGAADIPERLAAADIYLSTSILEGTSNSILEALRAGLPVVATKVGDNARMIDDRETGFLENAKDVESLASDVVQLVNDAEMRRVFGKGARRIVQERYSVDAVLDQYKKVLQ